jgi:glycosyltransferase involved in cell wall biosynthesis
MPPGTPIGDVLCLSHLRWGFVYQRPNHLMSRCARDRRVFFVEEPVLGAPRPRLEVSRLENGLHVVVPHVPHGPSEVVESMLRDLIDGLTVRARIEHPLLWFYTPMALAWMHHPRGQASVIVYDCMDELSHFDGAPAALLDRERDLFSVADVVFTGGQSLYEAKRTRHPRVHAFPSSVDASHFGASGAAPEPADQAAIPHPRLGFFGVIDERMDLRLLRELAAARPDLQIVMIGPIAKIDRARLPRAKSLHWLGQRAYAQLPGYLAGWDVAIMPFSRNAATKFISPTKTLEYLAAGKRVVSTSIRDVVRPYGEEGLVAIADTPAAFAAAVDAALAERGTPAEAAWRAASEAQLASTSWDKTWARMWALVRADVREEVPCLTI